MEKKYFKIVGNIDIYFYKMMPMYDDLEGYGYYESIDIPYPSQGDYLIISTKNISLNISFSSATKDLTEISWKGNIEIKRLLAEGKIQEVSRNIYLRDMELSKRMLQKYEELVTAEIYLDYIQEKIKEIPQYQKILCAFKMHTIYKDYKKAHKKYKEIMKEYANLEKQQKELLLF
ncbi:hypothetical protein [Thermoanaerobacterium sp. RBIITD]|uniref:hypothetical protein n=1 Tax=Thermoanaerobacterium sp. RBIITD TaxID=1550240 RepID=UPI000BB68FA3|nr:hypothetical protein [Thermoanaerobacterium sp. RBIITD]SNX54222.1 hypothetical protein SAMN05660242_1859 [Thermoanaerobacterium sp. RBIITD]